VIDAAARTGVDLRVVGARGWGGIEARGANVTWLGQVGDDELARLYRGALCVVYASLYEGFGLPVLEAMACGAAVVTSAGGATEEIAGAAAVLVDPLDTAAIAAGIETAIAQREHLRAGGLEHVRPYSWDASARLTRAVYEAAS
jgi:glycosyltransferase involved in cell wall biosynthesis